MSITLRDGSTTQDKRLDRLIQFDTKSKNYPAVRKLGRDTIRSYTHNFRKYPVWLDQKIQGSCVSFGIGHDLLCYPQEIPVDNALVRSLYFDMQRRDPWPGGAWVGAEPFYEGTSVLAGLGVYQELLGRIDPYKRSWAYRWCFGGDDVLVALGRRGVIIGVSWLEGMFDTDAEGFIHVSGDVAGGHCTYLRGVKVVWQENATHDDAKFVDRERTVILGRNSWGAAWGLNGDFKITLADLDKLLAMDGEAAVLEPDAARFEDVTELTRDSYRKVVNAILEGLR